jgi:acylphosphatase
MQKLLKHVQHASTLVKYSTASEATTSVSIIGVHFHHIYSDRKKKEIVELARKNNISGFVRFGKPGRLLVQSDDNAALKEYIKYIRQLRWQFMALRIQRTLTLKSGDGFSEFKTFENDKDLIQYMKEANMLDLFSELSNMPNRSQEEQTES